MTAHHRFCEIWPLIKGKPFADLVHDIKAHGLRVPIVLYKGQILDGRNRELACAEAGITPRYEEAQVASDDEALELVFSLNQLRRHLSKLQAIVAAEKFATIAHGSNQYRKKEDSSAEPSSKANYAKSITKAADRFKKFGVTAPAVKRMRAIRRYAGEAGVQEVLSGKISLTAKANQARTEGRANRPIKQQVEPAQPKVTHIRTGTKKFALSREQVDPEFKGDNGAFKDKYGHVVMHTAEERARMRFGDWAAAMRMLAKDAKHCPLWSDCDEHWLRSPRPQDVARMTEALEVLRPKMARAEALLQIALGSQRNSAPVLNAHEPVAAEGGELQGERVWQPTLVDQAR